MHNADKNINHFELLKQNIVATMQQSYPGINPEISDWKGQEITDFQEELLMKVNAHISERWFYNHIKTTNKSLPRIDILNLLSKYVGFANWDDFVFKNSSPDAQGFSIPKANRIFIIVPLLVLLATAILLVLFRQFSNREYRFSFYDAYTREAITDAQIEITVLPVDESPKNYLSDSLGVVVIKTNESVLKMVIHAPYYKSDTITRILKNFDNHQKIGLRANEYELIIKYFSEMNVADWEQRREFLDKIIDEGALIYQVLNDINASGMALYNKAEFIDKLTIPTGSLKNIEIIESKFKDDKIMILRFRVNQKAK